MRLFVTAFFFPQTWYWKEMAAGGWDVQGDEENKEKKNTWLTKRSTAL